MTEKRVAKSFSWQSPPPSPPTSPVSMWEFPGSSSATQKRSSGNRDSRTRVGGNTKHPAGYYKKPCYGQSWTCLYCRLRIIGNVTRMRECAGCGVTLRCIFVAQRGYNEWYYALGHACSTGIDDSDEAMYALMRMYMKQREIVREN